MPASRSATSIRRLVVFLTATLMLSYVHGVARAQGETAGALASPAPDFDANVFVFAPQQ